MYSHMESILYAISEEYISMQELFINFHYN